MASIAHVNQVSKRLYFPSLKLSFVTQKFALWPTEQGDFWCKGNQVGNSSALHTRDQLESLSLREERGPLSFMCPFPCQLGTTGEPVLPAGDAPR